MPDNITISSKITKANFRDFAVFDTLIRQNRIKSPLIFSFAFAVFALICFLMRNRAQQAMLLGVVMLGIAVIFPGTYFISFFLSIRRKAGELELTEAGRHAYTVNLTNREITITNAIRSQSPLRLSWEQLYHAYRTADCIYLYVSPQQAFLLPDNDANVSPDELWSYLGKKMTAGKLTDRRR